MGEGAERREGKIPDWPKPTERPDRQVLVLDAPDYTQTQVTLTCQLERTTSRTTPRRKSSPKCSARWRGGSSARRKA
jgi:hypothetical protein